MKITVDYNEEKESHCYYEDVKKAAEIVNAGKSFIYSVEYINFPMGEIDLVLSLINEAVNHGKIEFNKGMLIYSHEDVDLHVEIPTTNQTLHSGFK